MLEETNYGLPPINSPRQAAMMRQCKLLHPEGSESEFANCPCDERKECRFPQQSAAVVRASMEELDLQEHLHFDDFPLPKLAEGMVVAVYVDDGPMAERGGVSHPRSMANVYIFQDRDSFLTVAEAKNIGRNGKNAKVFFNVIGEYGNASMQIFYQREVK